MANQTRTFDPEAADEFISFLESEIDALRTQVIDTHFKNGGALVRMPAFGTGGGSDQLRSDYTAFFTSTWSNLQGAIASYTGFIDTLKAIKESYAAADAVGAADLDQQI